MTAEIEFTDLHGQKQDVSEDTCGDYTQGQTVTVWYLPNDPHTFTTDQQVGAAYLGAFFVGLFSLPLAIILLILLVRALLYVPLLLVSARRSRQPQPAFASPIYQPQPISYTGYSAPPAYPPYSPTVPAASPQLAPPTSQVPLRTGQTAEIDNLCSATLTRVNTSYGDANALPLPGYVYLLVGVALRNRSSQPLDAFSAGRFQLWDMQGNEYQPTLLPGTVFYLTDMLQPGKQQDDQLAFSVPTTIHEFRLTFQRDRSSPPLATWEMSV